MKPVCRIGERAAFIACLMILVSVPAQGGEMARKVKTGESLSIICQKVYGDKELYRLIALYNSKKDPTRISAGETLRLPFSDTVALKSGESLSMLAKRVWGEPGMYPVLVWANGVKDAEKVPAGTRLSIPVLVPYTLKQGQSVSAVAGEFYGNPKAFEVILNASGIEDPTRVPAGTLLKIPYVIPRPVAKKQPVRTSSRPAPRSSPKPAVKKTGPDPEKLKALKLVSQAETVFKEGRFGQAWTLADEAAGSLDGKEKAKAYRLMAATQYAFGKTDAALDDLKKAYELDPEFKPDPAYVNPEMMELYKQASTQYPVPSTK